MHQALDAWSWFWIGIEASAIFTLTGLGLIACGVYTVGFQTLGGTLLLAVVGLPTLRNQCQRYAVAQVRAILADPGRAATVRAALEELTGARVSRRLAA